MNESFLEIERRIKKTKSQFCFKQSQKLDEWQLEAKKRHFGNPDNPTAVLSDSLIG